MSIQTMCRNKCCTLRHNCLRYVAKPANDQHYVRLSMISNAEGRCNQFLFRGNAGPVRDLAAADHANRLVRDL